MVQLSCLCMTSGKAIALTTRTFVSKVMSLLFNKVCHSFSFKEQASFNFMAAVTLCSDFGSVSIVSLSICHEVIRLDAMALVF